MWTARESSLQTCMDQPYQHHSGTLLGLHQAIPLHIHDTETALITPCTRPAAIVQNAVHPMGRAAVYVLYS